MPLFFTGVFDDGDSFFASVCLDVMVVLGSSSRIQEDKEAVAMGIAVHDHLEHIDVFLGICHIALDFCLMAV